MPSLRTLEGKKAYQEYLAQTPVSGTCPLCEKFALRTFKLWKIVENSFPYDLIAREHHMLVSLRHITESGLTADELRELLEIKNHAIEEDYDWIIEPVHKNKSIPDHFHLHLLVGK